MDGFDVIHSYSRAQAIEDGVLVDVTATAREAGFKHHTVITEGVQGACVTLTRAAREAGNDEKGRLWDVVFMASMAVRRARGGDRVSFKVAVVTEDAENPEEMGLYVHIGPGDKGEPVLTIMLDGED